MTDEISPEEKLLRLIKGEKKPPPAQTPEPEPDTSVREPKKDIGRKSAAEQTDSQDDKKRDDTPSISVKPDKPVKKVIAEPVLIVPDKSAPKKTETAESSSELNQTASVKPEPKPAPRPAQPHIPPVTATATVQETAEDPAGTASSDDTPVHHGYRGGFVGFIIWFLSGFTAVNWLLILLLIAAVWATFWHFNIIYTQRLSVPMSAQPTDVPEIPVEKEVATDEGMQFVPKPFPYYMEVISSKNLFRLVEPPPPPAPPKPAVEAPKEPEVKIDTLTRHLVLQGIVYDIDPPQAIIFDKKDNKTLFLGNGQMVTDQVKLKEIQRGKVILEFEDQTQELTF